MNVRFLLLALLAFTLISCTPRSEQLTSKISTSGLASSEVKPDIAIISFEMRVYHKDPAAATKELSLSSQKLSSYLEKINIKANDIEARDIRKDTVRKTDADGQEVEIVGYEIHRDFSITLNDLTKFESTMRELYAMPFVSYLTSTFKSNREDQVADELLQKACAQAKTEGEKMAKGFGVKLGKVLLISKDPIQQRTEFKDFSPYPYVNAQDLERVVDEAVNQDQTILKKAPLFYPPATLKLSQHINAIYELNN